MLEHLLQLTSYHIAVMKNSLLFWNPLAARVNHWGPKAHLSFVRTEAKWTPSCPAAEEWGKKNTLQVKITRGACKSCKDKWLLAGNKKLFTTHSSFLDHSISLQGPEKSKWGRGGGGMGRWSGRRRRGSRRRGGGEPEPGSYTRYRGLPLALWPAGHILVDKFRILAPGLTWQM